MMHPNSGYQFLLQLSIALQDTTLKRKWIVCDFAVKTAFDRNGLSAFQMESPGLDGHGAASLTYLVSHLGLLKRWETGWESLSLSLSPWPSHVFLKVW